MNGVCSLRKGVVREFDEPRGIGIVLGDDGDRYHFHCTQIADGSRSVDVGTRVVFFCAAGHLGRLEAAGIAADGAAPESGP